MKKDVVIAAVAVVIVTAVAFGLSAVRPELPPTPSQPFSAEGAGGSGGGERPGANEKIVMHVNGEPVTEREFVLFIQAAPADAQAFYASPPGRRALADELVKMKVLEQEARRLGLTDDPDLRTQIAMARTQITASRALEKISNDKVEDRIRSEYEKEKGSAIALRHILIAYAGGAVPARGGAQAPSADAAMQKATAIAAKIRGGADFAATAAAESDDEQSGQKGGMLGPARPDMLPQDIAAVVGKMKPGQMSEPVKTQFGIHIFKVEQPSLEDLRPMLRQRVRQSVAEQEVKRLQGSAKVELDPKFFPNPGNPREVPIAAPTRGQ